jgi:PAS domain S-box-containing protein
MEVTLSRKRAKSQTRGRKLHLTEAKARGGRARKTRGDLEQELRACRREIAHARERLVEATKQQTATSEMLRIISNSPIKSVLDAVAENAARLCDANNAEIFRLENNLLRLAASYGEIPVVIHAYQGVPVNRDTVTGRAACDRRTIHVHDLAAEESEYPVGSSNAKREGHRTTLATPLLREGSPVGIILVRRMEVRPFSDEQIALIETFADQAVITIENVRLYNDLREREARIRRLVDSNIIGIFIWDFEGRILEANDEFLRMVSYDREDLVSGRIRWADLTPPDWRDRNNARIEQQKSSGRFEPFEKEYTRKDGTRVPVLIGGATFEEGGNQGVAFVLDLTERKRAEYLTQQMFERSSDRVSIVGRDYRYQRVNPAFERRWGMPAETIVGMHVADLLGMESFEQMAKAYLDRCFAGEEVSYADWLTTPLGRRYSAVTYSPLRPESERVEAALVIIRDLTEHMLASEALRKAQLDLAHANRVATMGQLTASITHEVNQPITAAVTYALAARRWLSAEPPNFHEVDDALSLIVKEGNRAGEVVGRIRALIKKAPARKDAVEINDAILEVIALTRTEAANNSVSVRTQFAEGLPRVQGDRVQLQQVLLNLIINAIEAMRDVGEEERELLISTRNEPDGVSVEVRDSGPGFAPETLEHVFEAFYTTKPGGLGLGLSICRSIIEAHGGRLWASPNVPRGAIFGFIAPAHLAAAS